MEDDCKENTVGTTCKSIPNTKILEVRVSDETYFYIACISLYLSLNSNPSEEEKQQLGLQNKKSNLKTYQKQSSLETYQKQRLKQRKYRDGQMKEEEPIA